MKTPFVPTVRLDLHASLARLAEMFVRRRVEPAVRNTPLWDNGLGDVVQAALAESKIPESVTAVDIARALKILPARPRIAGGRR